MASRDSKCHLRHQIGAIFLRNIWKRGVIFIFFIRSRVSKEIGKKIGREGGKEKMTENKIIVRYVHKVQTSKSFDGWTRYSVRWTI